MEYLKNNLLNFLIFFLVSFLTQHLLLTKLKNWTLDNPNHRSLHKSPTPTSGGVVFVAFGTIGALYFDFYLPFACLPLSIIGLIDDRLNISRKLRYFVQIITVSFLINLGALKIDTNNILLDYLFTIFLIIFLTAIINFINFMDGIDGLVAGSMILYFIVFSSLINPSLISLLGCLTAFLIFNWNPAKVFMGDVGSTFLGALFAGVLLQMSNWIQSLQLLIIASPLLADAFICVIRRFLNRENIFKPHRKHLYQRLIGEKGLTHSRVSLIYILASFSCVLSIYFDKLIISLCNLIGILIIGVYLDKVIAKPFIEKNKIN